MSVIVLDGDQRSALAVTRSLGGKGIFVNVGAEVKPSLSSCSKFCCDSFTYPSPYIDAESFIQKVLDYTKKMKFDAALFPMTDITLSEVLKNREIFPSNIKIPFEKYNKYLEISNKAKLFRLCTDLDIPMPKTYVSTDYVNCSELIDSVMGRDISVVVKPGFSKIRAEKKWFDAGVKYANDINGLRNILSREPFISFPYVVQERINGPGIGIFLLTKEGNAVAKFAHRRVREKPPSGGVSVLCESIRPPEIAMRAAVKILEKLRWTGVAMIEFKMDERDKIPKILEVNARFWGSLQLAIASGVDFPYLLYLLANEECIEDHKEYTIGLRSRWELGDIDHLYLRFAKSASAMSMPPHYPTRFHILKEFIADFFRPSVQNEVLKSNDPRPFLHEMKQYIRNIVNPARV